MAPDGPWWPPMAPQRPPTTSQRPPTTSQRPRRLLNGPRRPSTAPNGPWWPSTAPEGPWWLLKAHSSNIKRFVEWLVCFGSLSMKSMIIRYFLTYKWQNTDRHKILIIFTVQRASKNYKLELVLGEKCHQINGAYHYVLVYLATQESILAR